MTAYFVDTSAWYELVDAAAPRHAEVTTALAEASTLVTTTFVLHELVALLVCRGRREAAQLAGARIRRARSVHLVHPDVAEEESAWRLFLERPDKAYLLTDCLSFQVMRRLRVEVALATDRHFAQEGFSVIP